MKREPPIDLRRPSPLEVDHLADLWCRGWHEAHAAHVPPALTRLRTRASFVLRMANMLDETRVAGPPGHAHGFCTIKEDELMHLFVAPGSHGRGVAAQLLADGEVRLADRGVEIAWLACVIGNRRAAHFYEKHGWLNAGTMVNPVETSEGPFLLEEWRYEKPVSRDGRR